MVKVLIGVVIGIAVATVGFQGLAKMADKGVEQTKVFVKEASK